MYNDLGPGQEVLLDPPLADGFDLLYDHGYVAKQTRNLYDYAMSNPLNRVDTIGLASTPTNNSVKSETDPLLDASSHIELGSSRALTLPYPDWATTLLKTIRDTGKLMPCWSQDYSFKVSAVGPVNYDFNPLAVFAPSEKDLLAQVQAGLPSTSGTSASTAPRGFKCCPIVRASYSQTLSLRVTGKQVTVRATLGIEMKLKVSFLAGVYLPDRCTCPSPILDLSFESDAKIQPIFDVTPYLP